MVLILELGAAIVVGLFVLIALWRTRERGLREIEMRMRDLTGGQVKMLRSIRDPEEFSRTMTNMHNLNRRLSKQAARRTSN